MVWDSSQGDNGSRAENIELRATPKSERKYTNLPSEMMKSIKGATNKAA